jgi:hypothetical protein
MLEKEAPPGLRGPAEATQVAAAAANPAALLAAKPVVRAETKPAAAAVA